MSNLQPNLNDPAYRRHSAMTSHTAHMIVQSRVPTANTCVDIRDIRNELPDLQHPNCHFFSHLDETLLD
jgi:hypothetical protein